MIAAQVLQPVTSIVVIAVAFALWLWLACLAMKYIPVLTGKLGLGETPGLIVAVISLWPLFALTYQLCRHFLPS
ncbi:hypothetical protein [Desulfotomaculum nigrificans]|uniref:hypothetical protein n=1 Tax=Desulfotomaculum nigrificans TaxID=1565 RepID=UPI0002DD5F0B|nr:hypothetical protein [Desulfotomaculum nigrificans]